MGQVQSGVDEPIDTNHHHQEPPSSPSTESSHNNSQPASLESLIAEAEAFGNDASKSLDERAQKALDCPCIADLRKGPCGTQFSGAFLCFLKSTAEEKGSDCVHPFVALQSCIKAHPDAFSKDILEGEEGKDQKVEQPTEEHKIIPPLWSVVSPKSKSKL